MVAPNPPPTVVQKFQNSPQITELPSFARSVCIAMPRFSGEHPSAWISRVHRYFDYYNIHDNQRLLVASFYLDGDALEWFELMSRNGLCKGWPEFLVAFTKRFGPAEYEPHFGKLSTLTQSGSSADYHPLFDELSNEIISVCEPAAARSFKADSNITTHEENHDINMNETNEGDFKNAESSDDIKGLIVPESELVMSCIEHHSLEPVAYLGELAEEIWHTLEGELNMMEISMELWAERNVYLEHNFHFSMHFQKDPNLLWLWGIKKKKPNTKGSCPTIKLIQRYSGRKMVKRKREFLIPFGRRMTEKKKDSLSVQKVF